MATSKRCPVCRAVIERPSPRASSIAEGLHGSSPFPFCSERCRVIDLGRWLDEGYRVPSRPDTAPGAYGTFDDDEADDTMLH